MQTDTERQAVTVLRLLAQGSALRVADGLRFWGGHLFQRRIVRHMAREFPVFLSRLMDDLQVPITSVPAQELTTLATTLDHEAATRLMVVIRAQTTLLVALAFDDRKTRSAKSARAKSDLLPISQEPS